MTLVMTMPAEYLAVARGISSPLTLWDNMIPWTHPPYGYRVDPTHLRDPAGVRLEPAEGAVVADLFASPGMSEKSVDYALLL